MRLIADLHVHSRYSRATSRDMSPETIWRWARLKGITVAATGDFTHPLWIRELRDKLTDRGDGTFALKKEWKSSDIPPSCSGDPLFLLSAEISCIYGKAGKTRKIHCLIYVPSFREAETISRQLSRIGNLSSDGRPILGLDAKDLLGIVIDTSPEAVLVPAHAWTPHFSVFGSASGFDSIEECFEDLSPQIFAIETGLSSDPLMNWRVSPLDRFTLVSNSDAHSPSKLGREATIMDVEPSYSAIMNALRTRQGFLGTIEFFPEEGKYHFDGHRDCGISLSPRDTLRHNYACPVCGRRVTVGVMHRVESLSDRPEGMLPEGAPAFHRLIPLVEILSEVLAVGVQSKAVSSEYMRLVAALGNELAILMDVPPADLERQGSALLREAITRVREGRVYIAPGYDGEYGKIRILREPEKPAEKGQTPLF